MQQPAGIRRGATRPVEPPGDWSWEAYAGPAGIPPPRVSVARACVAGIGAAVTRRRLAWSPRFSSWYVGFYRPGGYNVVTVDLRTAAPLVAARLPDPPEALGLKSPYPDLEQRWDPVHRQWGWFVPAEDAIPDFGAAIDLIRPFQPESGPM